ncbi:hypothetical protein QQS21_000175 [Conoideocrella luteorostrata]|uniref:FAD dependent oxidoreductase domain-containing protein n=1 Tax=Conoideocrella luteorostrata TaxID=1105319 RepID=A0AAJ0CZ75_9HYPO|nr:hypothetical protein QQS21_000175 [Conoideocrella luteorostrata]
MTKITIFGAGITGMAIASQLAKDYEVTIVARDLPDDTPSQQWSSPWACAGWVALGGSPAEQQMQLDSLAYCLRLAKTHPESSVRAVELTDIYDVGATEAKELWYYNCVPGFQELDTSQLTGDQKPTLAVKYTSFVLSPKPFLAWLRCRLESSGVTFERIPTAKSLGELSRFGHDILINASGLASTTLADVEDKKMISDRTYTILVKSDYNKAFVRRGATEYTYIFGRHDGTTVVGGISEPPENEVMAKDSVRTNLLYRANLNLPKDFPSAEVNEYNIVEDLQGIRPLRLPGVRVEQEVIDGQMVVHAYGTTAGGYIYSFGLAREVAKLVDKFVFDLSI